VAKHASLTVGSQLFTKGSLPLWGRRLVEHILDENSDPKAFTGIELAPNNSRLSCMKWSCKSTRSVNHIELESIHYPANGSSADLFTQLAERSNSVGLVSDPFSPKIFASL